MVTISSLDKFLKEHRNVFIDTSLFIYHVEKHPRYHILCDKIFKDIETGRIRASTSTLSLLEILLQPYRLKNESLIFNFYSLLTTYPNLMWIDLTLNIADLAARLRAEYNLKTPDSIQAASAIASGAAGFICNDSVFKKLKEIKCLILDDCV
ncbi:MAG TPA: PIN domain nuclease [Deltaproteobacteria bacterium]|nr:MAG: hypothetical protein A2Z89_03535 [Deltaproteobacteria bacterium GWA2_43_19]OGQ10793.1 MAG: hypothetical protein A3D30_08230 [Deltaproteobacteria bacterium RIFCSPHIGHO2_02_FULL_43_33]OGQ33784.1 MAG: hypothetical protein A3A85_00605 [Deltaproteobacteria bacterium RIFCSPLOWO2_01_FULL_42_9]HBR18180.1 PIN domain nuclease [Deltaproteobacteria bacterium]